MTLVPYDTSIAPTTRAGRSAKDQSVSQPSVLGAAFRQENPVVAGIEYMSRPEFEPEEGFDLKSRIESNPIALTSPDTFLGVQSGEEFEYLLDKVKKEQRDKARLASAGAGGLIAAIGAGVLSPTIFLPGGAIARGGSAAKTAVSAASWAAIGAGLDEAILQADQETRTTRESVTGIGTAAVLGGMLGGAFGYLSKGEIRQFEQDMVLPQSGETIQPYNAPSAVGAQIAGRDAGGAAVAKEVDPEGVLGFEVGVGRFRADIINGPTSFLSPVSRTLNQKVSPAARWMQAQLSSGGMYLKSALRGEVAAPGGEVEQLVKQHYTGFYKVKRAENQHWYDYQLSVGTPQHQAKFGLSRGMNRKEFDEAVGRALANPDAAEVEQVKAVAQLYRDNVFLPMLREAEEAGMFKRELKDAEGNIIGEASISAEEAMQYFPRVVKQGLAKRDYDQLQQVLKEHFEEVLVTKSQEKLARLEEIIGKDEEALDDLSLQGDEVVQRREQLKAEIASLPDRFPAEVRDIAEEIRALRAEAKVAPAADAKELRAQAKKLEQDHKETLANFRKAENKIKQRFSRLTKTKAGIEERRQKVLEQIDRVEDQQTNSLLRAQRSIQKLVAKIPELGPERFQAEVEKVKGQIERAFQVYVRGEERLDGMKEVPEGFEELVYADARPTEKISKLEDRQAIRAAALDELYARLDDLEGADQTLAVDILNQTVEDLAKATNKVNNKRALRLQRLEERAAELTPEANQRAVGDLSSKIRERRLKFMEDLQTNGGAILAKTDPSGERFLLEEGDFAEKISFADYAEDLAHDVANKMAGNEHRVPAMVLMGERGPELARTLNIDPDRTWSNGKKYADFLEWDAEVATRRYIRTMAPDIELYRKFGTVNPMQRDSPIRERIMREFNESKSVVRDDKKLTKKQKEKKLDEIQKTQDRVFRDLNAQIDRLRHQRGIPENPNGFAYRSGRVALNLNTTRLMGGVVVASVPDMMRPVMKHGLMNTFKHGYLPMITNLKGLKASAAEARYAGTALDLTLHGRSAAMFDIFDEVEHGSQFERALQWGTNNFGRMAGFDYWNVGMKSLTASVTNARLMKALEDMSRGKAKQKDVAFLAASGIDEPMARQIWQEVTQTPGGGNQVNGVYLPNTESWASRDAVRAYRAALARSVDDTIVTPGLERPLWMDANMFARLVAQFRSFTFSSTQKILVAAAQDARVGNMVPVLIGSTFSLALGALSYYTWAVSRGGDSYKEMQNADADKWADEIIKRSGLIGVLSEVQNVAQDIPGLDQFATFSGSKTSRTSYFNTPFTSAFGPTLGLIQDGERVAVTAHDPTKETLRRITNMTPFQNHTLLSRGFDLVEQAAGDALGVR